MRIAGHDSRGMGFGLIKQGRLQIGNRTIDTVDGISDPQPQVGATRSLRDRAVWSLLPGSPTSSTSLFSIFI